MATYKTTYDFEIVGNLQRQLGQHLSLFRNLNREVAETHRLLANMRVGGGSLGHLRGMAQEINALHKAMRGFAVDPLDKMAASFGKGFERRIDAITRHVESRAASMERSLGRLTSFESSAGRGASYGAARTIHDRAPYRSAHRTTHAGQHGISTHEASAVPGVIGVGGGIHTMVEIIGKGAEASRENIRQKNAGLTPAEIKTLNTLATSLSQKYPSIGKMDIREQGRLLIPNVGDFKSAVDLLPNYIEGQAALQTIAGPKEGKKDMEAFARYVDIIGRSMNSKDTRRLIDGYVRARQLDAEAVKSLDYVNAAKSAASVGKSLDVGFWAEVAPALFSQQGGARTGTDIASAYQNTAVNRATDSALLAQAALGMRHGLTYTVDKNGKKKVINKGGLNDPELYGSNPYEWAKKNVVPDMVARGMLPEGYGRGEYSQDLTGDQRSKGVQYLSERFSNRRGANVFSMMIQDMDQLEKFFTSMRKTRGLEDVMKDQRKDAFVSGEALKQQAGNVASALSEPSMANIVGGLNRLNDNMGKLAGYLEKHPGGSQAAFSGVAAGVGGLTAAGVAALTLAAVGTLSLPALTIGSIAAVTIGSFLFPWEEFYKKMGWKPGIALGGKDVGGKTLNPGDELPGLGGQVGDKVAKGITGYDFGSVGQKSAKGIGTGYGTFDFGGVGHKAGTTTAKSFEAAPFEAAGSAAAWSVLRGFLSIMGKMGEAAGVSGVGFGGAGLGGKGGIINASFNPGGANDNLIRALGGGGGRNAFGGIDPMGGGGRKIRDGLKGGSAFEGARTANQLEAYKALRGAGLSDIAARAYVANVSGESIDNPRDFHWDGKHTAEGIVQWDPQRAARIAAQFGKRPRDMSVAEQTRASLWEMQTRPEYRKSWEALQSGTNGAGILNTLIGNYERPKNVGEALAHRLKLLHRFDPSATVVGAEKLGTLPNGLPSVLKPKSMQGDPSVPGAVMDRGKFPSVGPPPKPPTEIHTHLHLEGKQIAKVVTRHQAKKGRFPGSTGGPDTYGHHHGPATHLTDVA